MKIWRFHTPAFVLYWGFCVGSRQNSASNSLREFNGTSQGHAQSASLHHQRQSSKLSPSLLHAGHETNRQPGFLEVKGKSRHSGSIALLQGNIISRGFDALQEWWVGWLLYIRHGAVNSAPQSSSAVKAGNGHGFMGGEGKNHSWSMAIARAVSVLLASLIPLGALAAGGLLWRAPRVTFRIMLAVLLIALIFLGSAPPSMRKPGATPLIIAIWGLFCMGIYLGAPLAHEERRSRRSAAEIQKEQQLDGIWDAFFKACSERGKLELQNGRFSVEEVEGADPRLLIAVPGLVFLQCVLNSITSKKKSMELPGGTTVLVSAELAEDTKATPGRREDGAAASSVFSRLAAIDHDLRRLAPLTDAEVSFIEARVLQVCPESSSDLHRETEINLVAGALISAATEVTQIPAFKKRMGGAMNNMVCKPDTQSEKASNAASRGNPRASPHCRVSGLPLAAYVRQGR